MELSYEKALAVQRRHEATFLGLPGVSGVGVKQRAGGLALVVNLTPGADVPAELTGEEVDGLPLVIERSTYRLQ